MESTVNPAETAAIQPISKPKRRKLTVQDAQAIAELVISEKLTEREACFTLDINPDQWAVWKCRNKQSAMFESLCTKMRGAEIGHSMRTIKACGDGIGMKQPDWRAHAFRLSVIAPERFNPSKDQNVPQANVGPAETVLAALLAMSAKVYAQLQEQQPKAIEVSEVKQIAGPQERHTITDTTCDKAQ